MVSGPVALAAALCGRWLLHRRWANICVLNGILFVVGRMIMALLYSVVQTKHLYFYAMGGVSIVASYAAASAASSAAALVASASATSAASSAAASAAASSFFFESGV